MHDVLIEKKILAKNDEIAARNRKRLRERGIFSINLISSPGSGKTAIIEKTLGLLNGRVSSAVIEGDLQTDLDARRISACGVPVRQIATGRSCHLDAHLVEHELPWLLGLDGVELLIIENVGNMVCPAEYDLGEEVKVTVMSVTEGDDKPLKYPAIFNASEVLIINKLDLAPHTDFDMDRAKKNALSINPNLRIIETSCATGEGLGRWCSFLAASLGRSEVL